MDLKKLIKEQILLEKRIDWLVDTFEVTMSLEVIKHKGHPEERSKGFGRESIIGYDNTPVTNEEIKSFISLFKRDIAEKIITQEIKNEIPFVIKSSTVGLAIPIKPIHGIGTNWKLVIMTVWRESDKHKFRTFKNQLVIEK